MASVCRLIGAVLGLLAVGCAEPEQLQSPTRSGKTGSGGTNKTTTVVGSGGSSTTVVGSGGTTATSTGEGGATIARGGSTLTTIVVNNGGSVTTTTVGSGGLGYTPTCTDMIKNGDETAVDCGGSCTTKCAIGKACLVDADCATAPCVGGICTTCKNTTKDGDETDVDCGGSCPRCAEGQACAKVGDCATYNCDATTSTCGPMTNCLAAIPDTCTCAKKVVNASDAVGCQKVIDCYLTNNCKPGDACAVSNDSVCGNNTLGVDAGKANAALAVYTCACGA